MAYSMRRCGQGYAEVYRFTTFMNMPPPFTQNNYDKILKGLKSSNKSCGTENNE